ncbi:hypothetical protein CspeluHIS016_0111040 [Cutaneotrichosporon spelunceum]|uniref:Uncharacterized protein n=1 Tax=Cutaneotrichosporon spelunceum TaxID=1672016 RepID=A0AAD3Y9Z6_9TREE|nr:hypothetical protein CspeluHIS016_0111040 [Cutaneotrichosporon spelunceum]
MVLIKGFLTRARPDGSVLDLPVDQYDHTTHLPERIQVGPYSVKPLVRVSDVRDHLTVLAAFANVARREGANFARFASHAAQEYEFWALSILPRRRWGRLSGSSAGSSHSLPSQSMDSSPDASRRGSGRERMSKPSVQSISAAMEAGRSNSESAVNSQSAVTGGLGLQLPIHAEPLALSPTALSPSSSVSSLPSPTEPHHPRWRMMAASEIPPLTVLMAWHAHLLYPAQYASDTADGQNYMPLADMLFPLADVATAIRNGTLPTSLEHVRERRSHSISGWCVPDIAAAVQRQAGVVTAVGELGWLDPSFLPGPLAPLQRAIVRYHAWLDLFAATNLTRLGPTIDIELVWRTHQLRGGAFRSETDKLLGRPLDQTDRGDEQLLRHTGHLWSKRYGHSYVEATKARGILHPGRHSMRRDTV